MCNHRKRIRYTIKQPFVRNATVLAAISAPEAYATIEQMYDKVNINELDKRNKFKLIKIKRWKISEPKIPMSDHFKPVLKFLLRSVWFLFLSLIG